MSINKRLIKSNEGGGDIQFNAITYTGTASSGGQQDSITGVGFQPDFVYIKSRNFSFYSREVSTVMDAGFMSTFGDISPICATDGPDFVSYDSDGFTVQKAGNQLNDNGKTYVAYCWKLGGSPISNPFGTLTSTISANPDYGISAVRYTGNETNGATFGHGLNQAPEFIIGKSYGQCSPSYIFQGAYSWSSVFPTTNIGYVSGNNAWWLQTYVSSVNSSTVQLDNSTAFNRSLENLAYCFHSVEGFSKFGYYTGNGNLFTVDLGFKPALVVIKRIDSTNTANWFVYDKNRAGSFGQATLMMDRDTSENTNPSAQVLFLSNGFRAYANAVNSNTNFFYMAFADQFA